MSHKNKCCGLNLSESGQVQSLCLEQCNDPLIATRSRPSAADRKSAAEEIKWSDMSRILIGQLLGSAGK